MGRLWNVLIVAPSRQAAAGGWKDFKSPADASWQIVALACFHNLVSLEHWGSFFWWRKKIWLSGSGALWSAVTILSDQEISIAFQEFELILCFAKNRFPCLQKPSKSLICLYRKQSWPDSMSINNLPLARYLETQCITRELRETGSWKITLEIGGQV